MLRDVPVSPPPTARTSQSSESVSLIPVIDALIIVERNVELDEAVKALERPRFKKNTT